MTLTDLLNDNKLIVSILFILSLLILRWLVVRQLIRLKVEDEELPKRWSNSAKNAINLLIFVGLILIWLSELRFVALSIATFVVALVIATKELIQCLLGSFYHASTRSFSVGDWVKIGPSSGQVAQSDWLTTTLLDLDLDGMSYGYTGKTITVPNNQLLLTPVQNLNFMRRYVHHSFMLIRDAAPVEPAKIRSFILKQLNHYQEPFNEVAQRYNRMLENRLGIKLPGTDPSVRRSTTPLGKDCFSISFFCPTEQAIVIEQQLTDDLVSWWNSATQEFQIKQDSSEQAAIEV